MYTLTVMAGGNRELIQLDRLHNVVDYLAGLGADDDVIHTFLDRYRDGYEHDVNLCGVNVSCHRTFTVVDNSIEDLISELEHARDLLEDGDVQYAIDQLYTQSGVISTIINRLEASL